ncbi:MMPL family transporter [Tessaracoccus antarcticus]|uniref:MMPL family transporter n=1 Tax=Tessaracoccus antarcticus TaxID=2479848 RepID=A0A3M0GAT7_9ACTN|nr:MMPL family transporter [Tessaracoccus antarcticus]RMB61417.1 MMPL family transporter [Tessaracoccus antarcticus]
MSAQLYALGRWCHRNSWKVIGLWLALLAVTGTTGALVMGDFNDEFRIPGSSSQEALDRLRMTFPEGAALSATAIIIAPEGTDINTLQTAVEAHLDDFTKLGTVESVTSPWNKLVNGLINDADTAAIAQLTLDVDGAPTTEQLKDITDAADRLQAELPAGSQVHMGGEAYNIELPALSIVEGLGLIVALVVLFMVLGSLVAAGLPILTALIGVGVAMALMLIITSFASINSTTPLLAVMLGLAVGIDYALFILSRHRDQLRDGMEAEESTGRAVGTAGSAVIFAGLTVFIALLGLGVAGIPFLTVMGVFAALTVAFAVVIAITLLPALMGLLGERMRPRVRKPRKVVEGQEPRAPKQKGRAFSWWVGVTTKHPIITIVVVVLGLGGLSVPTMDLQLSLPNSGQHEVGAQDRTAYDLVDKYFGPGFNGPLIITADIIGSTDPLGLMSSLKADIEKVDGVASVPLATPNQNADTGLIQIIPTTGADDPATADLVQRLRDKTVEWEDRYGVETAVTGFTAVQIDVTDKLAGALLPFGLLVVGLSLILLTAVFRSVAVPIKATLGYLFSVGAAFGTTALVFNDGFMRQLINLDEPMPVISFLPILVMGILFGLAMDYEVFLVSRMREEYVHGKSAIDAIRDGFVASGPVVVAAAVIMFSVFAFFVPEGAGPIKQIAFALAVGVAVDAFLVRMTLVPAVMALLGDKAWWLPKWLDKLLPTFDVEGEVLTQKLAMANWPGTDDIVHAEGLAVDGIVNPIDLSVPAGAVVGIVGPLGPRTGAAMALTGRLETTSGRARVVGELLPESASTVRRRTTHLDLALVRDTVQALRSIIPRTGEAIVVDSVDAVGSAAERDALAQLVSLARTERSFALFLCATSAAHLEDFHPDGVMTVAETHLQESAV